MPRFYIARTSHLIKAPQPIVRIGIDFKGPLHFISWNRYLPSIVDEYSRFPFVFPCTNMTAETITSCLNLLFAVFGMPAYVHSDWGFSFLSQELNEYLTKRGIAVSRTTPYNPQGNGQCERYIGIIWKHITLTAASRGLLKSQLEQVLPEELNSIRSFLTATNITQHERLFMYQC